MGKYGYRRTRRNRGWRYAREHLNAAEELSQSVGGTDREVKDYFFSMSRDELRPVLQDYERNYGSSARQYAQQTIAAWRSGQRKMSGMVANRLFQLLPRHMPPTRKCALVESLWKQFTRRSTASVRFGREADPRAVIKEVSDYLNRVVSGHSIPSELRERFDWLAAGDTKSMEAMLNGFIQRDRREAVELIEKLLPTILRELIINPAIEGFRREIHVGGHTVTVFFDPRAKQIELLDGNPQFISATSSSWIVWIVFVGLLVLLMKTCNR